MHLTLRRHTHNQFGTFGELTCGDLKIVTVEQDWENNEPNVSCIPAGEYYLFPYDSPKFGKCFIIENESLGVSKFKNPNTKRFGCLIHAANLASQLHGCIAPGGRLGALNGEWAVLGSKMAMTDLMELLGDATDRPHTLNIVADFPTFIEE